MLRRGLYHIARVLHAGDGVGMGGAVGVRTETRLREDVADIILRFVNCLHRFLFLGYH